MTNIIALDEEISARRHEEDEATLSELRAFLGATDTPSTEADPAILERRRAFFYRIRDALAYYCEGETHVPSSRTDFADAALQDEMLLEGGAFNVDIFRRLGLDDLSKLSHDIANAGFKELEFVDQHTTIGSEIHERASDANLSFINHQNIPGIMYFIEFLQSRLVSHDIAEIRIVLSTGEELTDALNSNNLKERLTEAANASYSPALLVYLKM